MKQIEGNIIDICNRKIFPGVVYIEGDRIVEITPNNNTYDHYISPGFIDAHIHIESSMLTPVEFSKLVLKKGTVAVISDPHEIANVLGVEGISFMIEDSKNTPLKIFYTIPSCVPATPFDSAGSEITPEDTEQLAASGDFVALSEMMNVPGVIYSNDEVKQKIAIAHKYHLKIDGHAPELSGDELNVYIDAGISTDHECSRIEEAQEKINAGMKILIREGSAAKNYAALKSLISTKPHDVMFCTDDAHPDDIYFSGHIDKIVKKAIADGFDLFDVLTIACLNPIRYYGIGVGTLRKDDFADFIILRDLESFEVLDTYVAGNGQYNFSDISDKSKKYIPNKFNRDYIDTFDIIKTIQDKVICIQVINGELITPRIDFSLSSPVNNFESDIERDILKIVYLNRYSNRMPPQIGYIHGVGLKTGAYATSISHDSHNIIAVGCTDSDIVKAINAVITTKGGISVVNKNRIFNLPLPIAGIMTNESASTVISQWTDMIHAIKEMGSLLDSPFMALSFMSLIVIPELKIGEKGLFQFSKFDFIDE